LLCKSLSLPLLGFEGLDETGSANGYIETVLAGVKNAPGCEVDLPITLGQEPKSAVFYFQNNCADNSLTINIRYHTTGFHSDRE